MSRGCLAVTDTACRRKEKPVQLRIACGPIAANQNAGGPVAANENAGRPVAANQNAEWSQKWAIDLHTTSVQIYRD